MPSSSSCSSSSSWWSSSPSSVRRGRRGSLRSLVVVLALSALGVGCAPAAPAPTQAEYVAVADLVCEATGERLDEAEEELLVELEEEKADGGSLLAQRPDRWTRAETVPAYRDLEGSLRGIQPPDDDGTYLSDLYDDLHRRIEELRLSPGKGRDLIRGDDALRTRFETYGMEVCGTV